MDMKSSDCNFAKRQKIEEGASTPKQGASQTSCIELVLFNSDSLFKIASYLPATDLLNLALTCKRFGVAAESDNNVSGDESLSLIEETARKIVQEIIITTGEERPRNEGESWLANYHYLQSVVVFDQLNSDNFEYVEGNKSCININSSVLATAFSNNIMKTGRHFVSFDASTRFFFVGAMRPGTLINRTENLNPIQPADFFRDFFRQNFSQSTESLVYNTNNSIHCCLFYGRDGACYSSHWHENNVGNSTRDVTWMESFIALGGEVGMLLDLDEGTLSAYQNGQSLGVMKRGLRGHYCWAVSILGTPGVGAHVTIKREKVPEN